jgi:murein L,D-transpeptidase YafK
MRLRADLRRALFVATALTLSPAALASGDKSMAPIPGATLALMRAKGVSPASPILIRAYKKEAEMEVWKQGRDGRYVLLKTFPICRWSGQLGPKTTLGDRQTPEGFYAVGPAQMNPNSSYYLSFDIGYPNAFDQARGGSGSYLMVHGTCSSAGCFAMTDKGIGEIYALAREAFAGGQPAFQFQSYPFRMTAENMAKHRLDANIGFWRQLKEGADRFEATREELGVGASGGRYVFAAAGDPNREALAQARRAEEDARIAALVVQGKPAVRIAYADGGMHASFRTLARRKGSGLGQVSRPDALAVAGQEIELTPSGAPKARTCESASGSCPAASMDAKAPVRPAKAKQASPPKPAAPVVEPSAVAAERPLHERFLGLFRNEPPREPNDGRRI